LGPGVGEASGPSNLGDNMNPAAFFMLNLIAASVIIAFTYAMFGRD